MQAALLTGYPSTLAHRVLLELLVPTTAAGVVGVRSGGPMPARVYLLVRPKVVEEAQALLATVPPAARECITVFEGDVSAIDMGLSGAEHRELVAHVSLVHHTEHVAYAGVDRESAERVNVTGTREVLELARAAKARVVHYSTCYVSGDRSGVVREEELDEGQGFPSVIEETRARAEKLVARYGEPGPSRVAVTVVRCSTIVGDPRTGAYDRLEGPYSLVSMLLSQRAELGVALPGDRETPLHVVPVDYVARAAVALGFDARAEARTVHLTDPDPPSVPEVFDAIALLVGRPQLRGVIAPGVARAVMRSAFMQKLAPRPASLATHSRRVHYTTNGAEELLAASGIVCPSLPTYLPTLVDFVRQRRDADDLAPDSVRSERFDTLESARPASPPEPS